MKYAYLLLIGAFVLSGCVAVRSQNPAQQMQGRIDTLQKEVQEKDSQINSLQDELRQLQSQPAQPEQSVVQEEVKAKPASKKKTPKNIQTALQKAGVYQGPIDGKIGAQTKKAIKEFQRTQGLSPDGVVGKKTWAALSKHLE